MKQPGAPGLESRRADAFEAEMSERAKAWIPAWSQDGEPADFGRALLKVAARFASEVAERLDRAGDRMRLGFLDWLAVQGEAARPARVPVVFKLNDSARDPVLAPRGSRLQVDVDNAPVILETEKDVNLLPRQLKLLVAVDAADDRFYLSPPGISSLAPLEPAPTQWQLKSFAAAGAKQLQLDPETGLVKGMFIQLGDEQYELGEPAKDIVPIDPPLGADQPEGALVTKVTAFLPFDGAARNRQQHIIYLGHEQLLDVESDATIGIVGAKTLGADITWEYFGKLAELPDDEAGWHALDLPTVEDQQLSKALIRKKPRGKVEPFELEKGKKSRWLRGRVSSVTGSEPLLRVDELGLRVNCSEDGAPATVPPIPEAMANTTPLVLDSIFFPFGKEPRQFDAFYLGSTEAFSKKGAQVTLDFNMADTTFVALSAVPGAKFVGKLGGVAQDGALYILELDTAKDGAISRSKDRGPLRPPPGGTEFGSADVSAGVPLSKPLGRVPAWPDAVDANFTLLGVTAGNAVWLRREHGDDPKLSTWAPLGVPVISTANDDAPVDDLIFFADNRTLFALRGGELSWRAEGDASWTPVTPKDKNLDVVALQAIVPVLVPSAGSLVTSAAAGMIGIATDGKLHSVQVDGACRPLKPGTVDAAVRPVAVQSGDLFVAFAEVQVDGPKPKMFRLPLPVSDADDGDISEVKLDEPDAAVVGFDALLSGMQLTFLASVRVGSAGYLLSWDEPAAGDPVEPLRTDVPAGQGQPAGASTVISGYVVLPATRGRVLSAKLDLARRLGLQGDVSETVFAPIPLMFAAGEFLVRVINPASQGEKEKYSTREIVAAGSTSGRPTNEAFYELKTPFDEDANGTLHGFSDADKFEAAHEADPDKIKLDVNDENTVKDSLILAEDSTVHRVVALTGRIATLSPPVSGSVNFDYVSSTPIAGRVSPSLRLDAANRIDPGLLPNATLFFKASRQRQAGQAIHLTSGKVDLIELTRPWTGAVPGSGVALMLDATVGGWSQSLQDTATNPELSWEYWNGTGWWKLTVTHDETAHLKVSGKIEFQVPADIAATDWSGRTNYWIRARLIGGDYGREKVSIKSSGTFGTDDFVQTVVRSTDEIHAPSVVKLVVRYSVCKPVLPGFVITQDSGTRRDQSDANRTDGAMVEAFVPISALLRALAGADDSGVRAGCASECACARPASTPAPAADGPASAPGRALYLGFDAPLRGAPVNVLLLVQQERDHDDYAPMLIETLIADRFVPIVAHDTTRALGESGILTLAFTLEPTPRELFGQTLTWLRLSPRAGADPANWKPTVLGAYLNATWASATETLAYETVGSSQGEPGLTLLLARPPVLKDTLELRVREPLGEEERTALLAERPERVLSGVESLPGDWVLWDRVIDPDDESPTRRAYAFDEGSGEIRFGDGTHGRIPPVGRDSIVAFRYQRTERGAPGSADVPANSIKARSPLNLVSPIQTVEAVFAADQAAGGAPPEDTARVLRFGVAGLRHRGRVVTPADLEELALRSSRRIAQAHCFPGSGFIRLVVVMRGADPQPSAAQVRELESFLLSRAAPSLGVDDALRIGGPAVRRLRVDLRLRVTSLDDAGEVAQGVKPALVALFDTQTGGPEGDGWLLGENPTEADIASALVQVPRLEGIAAVKLREIRADRSEADWPGALKRHELAMLDDDIMRVEFESLEVDA